MSTSKDEAGPDKSGPNQPPTLPPSTHGPVIILQTSIYAHDGIRADLSKAGLVEGEHYMLFSKVDLAEAMVTPGRVQLVFMGTIRGISTPAVDLAISLKRKNPQLLTGWLSNIQLNGEQSPHFDFIVDKSPEGRARLVELIGQFHTQHE